MAWNDLKPAEKLEAIQSIWQRDMSAADIAAELTRAVNKNESPVSRNSVIGFYHRARTNAERVAHYDKQPVDNPLAAFPLQTVTESHVVSKHERAISRRAQKDADNERARLRRAERNRSGESKPAKKVKTEAAPGEVLEPDDFTQRLIPGSVAKDIPLEGYGVGLIDMTGCKWPTGETEDGHHLFCNASQHTMRYRITATRIVTKQSAYCARHHHRGSNGVTQMTRRDKRDKVRPSLHS